MWDPTVYKASEDLLNRIEALIKASGIGSDVHGEFQWGFHTQCLCETKSCHSSHTTHLLNTPDAPTVWIHEKYDAHNDQIYHIQPCLHKEDSIEDASFDCCCCCYKSSCHRQCLHPQTLASLLWEAIETLVDTILLFGPEDIVISFNGGKDAVVVLHLYRVAMIRAIRIQKSKQINKTQGWINTPPKPHAVFFRKENDEFEKVLDFVQRTADTFDINLTIINDDWISGIQMLEAKRNKTGPMVFVIGARQQDTREKLDIFQPSSRWLNPFLRIHPLLNFGYGHIWAVIRTLELSYCELYDEGYTSLGSKSKTCINPALCYNDTQLPAYMLKDWEDERKSRRF